MPISGRRIQIAGSASEDADRVRLTQAHEIVRELVRFIVRERAGVLVDVAGEPVIEAQSPEPALPQIFTWTILEQVLACLNDGSAQSTTSADEKLVVAVVTDEQLHEIPEHRRTLWQQLLDRGAIDLDVIPRTHRWHGALREQEARRGNILVILGGSRGVDHLTYLYAGRQLQVIPLDADIGAQENDGRQGGFRLSQLALSNPRLFFRVDGGSEAARLQSVSTNGGEAIAREVSDRLNRLLNDLEPPIAFFVRLLDPTHAMFQAVEWFFGNVVEPVVRQHGYRRHLVGTDPARYSAITRDVFETIHFSPLIIVDLTGERPNCFIELGYALRGGTPVLITARHDTRLPFDAKDLPCFMWDEASDVKNSLNDFADYWRNNLIREPLVSAVPPF